MKAKSLFLLIVLVLMVGTTSAQALPNSSGNSIDKIETEKVIIDQQISLGEKWLKGIFQCKKNKGYCLPDQEKVFTKRYLEFYHEELEIFEYPDFETKAELIAAENAFKNKWKNIYPLGKEIWTPFGMGNGMEAGHKLKNVAITHISDLKYSVLVDYGDDTVFSNNVSLKNTSDTFLINFIETTLSIDPILPVFMSNETDTILYDQATPNSKVIAKLTEENNQSLICLTATKDVDNRVWYKCYYPHKQIEGWTHQVSHWDLQDGQVDLPFLQNLSLANLQLGANPLQAKRLLGNPKSEFTEVGPVEVSGYIDEDDIVTTTSMEFDGIRLVYEDDRMIQAYINKPGKSFGWITCGDKSFNKSFLLKKFNLNEENIYVNDKGDSSIYIGGILSLKVLFDKNELVKSIEFNTGP